MSQIKILCLGDVVGERAVQAIKQRLPIFQNKEKTDFTVINCENASMGSGNGISAKLADELLFSGADALTSGNHIFSQYSIYSYLDETPEIVRPDNFPGECPGSGSTLVNVNGLRVLVMNVMGRMFMPEVVSDPFLSVEKMLMMWEGEYDISILDIHAEATSEKLTLAYYFDGKIDIIFGTHTHVPTADERILPRGTGYITDLGMSGPVNSSLGVKPEIVTKKMRTGMPCRFEVSDNPIAIEGAVFTVTDGKVTDVRRVRL